MSDKHPNEEEFIQQVAHIMSDETPLDLKIRIRELWLVISALQLANRHPGISQFMTDALEYIARQFQDIIEDHHPEACQLIEMGWHSEHDVDKYGNPAPSLKELTQCWTIHTGSEDPDYDGDPLAEIGRPQDWGDPRWNYRVYSFGATVNDIEYFQKVHCWIDKQMKEHEYLETFTSLITMILQPGINPKLAGKEYLAPDDFWLEEWGDMPPVLSEEDAEFNDFNY